MTRKRSARWIYKVSTAMSLALLAAACATDPNGPQRVQNLENDDERAEMLMGYCEKLHKAGDLRVAASICQRAYETNPSNPAPLYPLAEIYNELGATAQAGDIYRTALMMNPEDFDALYGLAKTSIDLGQYAEAEAQLERALQINDGDPRVYNALGVVKDQKGEHEVAQALYRTGLLIDSDNVPLRNNLGLSLALSGAQGESIEMLRSVAGAPGAGQVSSQNLALASTYKAPMKVSPDGDGPVEIRKPDDLADSMEKMDDGDNMASAKSKPLKKSAGKPAVALDSDKNKASGKPVALGSATAELPNGQKKSSAQDVAAGIPTEFIASSDFKSDKPKSKTAAKKPAKAKAAKTQTAAKPQSAKSKPTKVKKTAKASKGKKNHEYRVQLGAYQSQDRADKAWKDLMSKSQDLLGELPHSVVKADLGSDVGTVYRLRTGPLADRAASDALCSELKSRNVGCFVVSLPKGKAAAKSAPVEKLMIEPAAAPAGTKVPAAQNPSGFKPDTTIQGQNAPAPLVPNAGGSTGIQG